MAGERILVVDDEPTVREVVQQYLEREGYRVQAAEDGPTALAAFSTGVPDLIVLDLMLPGVDGLEVCRQVRANGATPIIMLTAKGHESDRIVGLELGADDYVVKPFSPRELVARVRSVCAGPWPRCQGRRAAAVVRRVDPATREVRSPIDRSPSPCASSICWPSWSAIRARCSAAASYCARSGSTAG